MEDNTFEYKGWKFNVTILPISGSKELQRVSDETGMKTLPEMVFGNNRLSAVHEKSGVCASFDAASALKKCEKSSTIKVKIADKWADKMKRLNLSNNATNFDWTYSTRYKGDLSRVPSTTKMSKVTVDPRKRVLEKLGLASSEIKTSKTPATATPTTVTAASITATTADTVVTKATPATATTSSNDTPNSNTAQGVTETKNKASNTAAGAKSATKSSIAKNATKPTCSSTDCQAIPHNGTEKKDVSQVKRNRPGDGVSVSRTTDTINIGMLMRQERILWFKEVVLFEDELHDNGLSKLDVKIRVMPSCFLIRLRFFLRVDGVTVRTRDTRYFHVFAAPSLLRVSEHREESVKKLLMGRSERELYADPESLVRILPIREKDSESVRLE